MNTFSLIVILCLAISSSEIMAQFPNSDPYQWKPLPAGNDRQLGGFGGGNERAGSVGIGGQQRINDKWEVGGKAGIGYGPGGINKKVDVGVGYNIGKNTQIRGSVGADVNRFGSDKRFGIGIDHRFGGRK